MDQEKPKIEKAQGVEKLDEEKAKVPISEGEMFFPELELKDIKALPPKERKEALDKWKEKYAYQKEGFAKMQEDFVSKIRENPDITLEDLNKNLEAWGVKYGFTPQQKKIAEGILEEYKEKHDAVSKYRKEYPEDEKLFEVMFGVKPQGKVEIIEGPLTLYIKCHHIEDYAFIGTNAFMSGRSLTSEDVDRASNTTGVSVAVSLVPELTETIIVKKAIGIIPDKDYDRTFVHEEQHAIKRLFKEIPLRENFFADFMEGAMNDDDEKIKNTLSRFFRSFREKGEIKAKGEIFSYLKSRYNDVVDKSKKEAALKIVFEIMANAKEGSSYNYFGRARKYFTRRRIYFNQSLNIIDDNKSVIYMIVKIFKYIIGKPK